MRESQTQIRRITICGIAAVVFLFAFPVFAGRPPQDSSTASPARADVKAIDPAAGKDGTKDLKEAAAPKPDTVLKNDRIFGVLPNYGTVEGSAELPPLSVKDKFKIATYGSFDKYEFGIVAVLAAKDQATDADSAYGQGVAGYAKRYGAAFADQAVENIMVGGVYPSLLREDPRYYQRGKGGFPRRFGYAFSRIFVTRTDSGRTDFNYSEFLGAATAAGISNLYAPAADRRFSNDAGTFLTGVAVDTLGNELKEFWPDVRRKVFHKK